MSSEHFDVVIVGAGLSGIGAAWHLQDKCPGKSYVILEGRDSIGGTWDLFRYPGIRSDSDMHTLGYNFKPWRAAKAIADGPSILAYVKETAAENGIEPHIRYQHLVTSKTNPNSAFLAMPPHRFPPNMPANSSNCHKAIRITGDRNALNILLRGSTSPTTRKLHTSNARTTHLNEATRLPPCCPRRNARMNNGNMYNPTRDSISDQYPGENVY